VANIPSRTLRLALAMRGGVSLAVWIGGAVAEIDLLRRRAAAAPSPRAKDEPTDVTRGRVYHRLLRLAGFNDVEVDVLAGASAGGLNAVLYGVAQAYGQPLEHLRDTWIELGDIGQLLRSTAFFLHPQVPSLLKGDSYFLPRLNDELVGLAYRADKADDHHVDKRLTITLSATMLPPEGRAELADEAAARAYFHFVYRPVCRHWWMSDVPADQPRENAVTRCQLARLGLAGRSTSSFPGAFEPGTIPAKRKNVRAAKWFPEDPNQEIPGMQKIPDMVDVFSAVQRDSRSGPFHVIDGGVFDNIPIGQAVQAIQLAPAAGPTERFLLYLDPDPPKPSPVPLAPPLRKRPVHSATPLRRRPAYSAINTAIKALAMKSSTESEQDDLESLPPLHRATRGSSDGCRCVHPRAASPPGQTR
jgi:patatin-related protein